MVDQPELRTARLLLRPIRDQDIDAFAALNADPRVMKYFPAALTHAQSVALVTRLRDGTAEHGFGPFAVEVPGRAPFIGIVGLWRTSFQAAFTPCVEVIWRLAWDHWGCGYATEAARASIAFGFEHLGLEEILAWTTTDNEASRRVMDKLGMVHAPDDDFDHPNLPEGHPLRRHVLYRTRTRTPHIELGT